MFSTSLKATLSPPTIAVRVPAIAPAGPPETAQSKKITSCDFRTEAILCDSPGFPEVVSTQYLLRYLSALVMYQLFYAHGLSSEGS